MLLRQTKRIFVGPNKNFQGFRLEIRSKFSSEGKLTKSYFHHRSPLTLKYQTISQSFDEIAEQNPDHTCLNFRSCQFFRQRKNIFRSKILLFVLGEGKVYTYKTFKEEVDAFAASLIELGFQKNDRIAVWLPNSSENVVASFAASKLGLIKVCFDRISFSLENFSFSHFASRST